MHGMRLSYRIRCLTSDEGYPRLTLLPFLSFPFSMLQLHSFALVLAALSGGVSAATVSTSLDIANQQIAPDGFSRL